MTYVFGGTLNLTQSINQSPPMGPFLPSCARCPRSGSSGMVCAGSDSLSLSLRSLGLLLTNVWHRSLRSILSVYDLGRHSKARQFAFIVDLVNFMRFVMTFLFILIARCAVSAIFFFTFGGGQSYWWPPSFENEGAMAPLAPPLPTPLVHSDTHQTIVSLAQYKLFHWVRSHSNIMHTTASYFLFSLSDTFPWHIKYCKPQITEQIIQSEIKCI